MKEQCTENFVLGSNALSFLYFKRNVPEIWNGLSMF